MIESILRVLFRLLIFPYRIALKSKLRSLADEAKREVEAGASPVPKMVETGSPTVRLTEVPSAVQRLDFTVWRAPTYVDPMTTEVADNLAAILAGPGRSKTPSMQAIAHGILHTPTAYLAKRVDNRWAFDFSEVTMYPGIAISVKGCTIDDAGTIEVLGTDGRVHTPLDDTYEAALVHLAQWWGIYVVSGLHNWVHFSFPCTMAEAQAALSRQDSVLARLLAPHCRFTSRINFAGLWENKSSHNPPDAWSLTRIYAGIPFTREPFQTGVVKNTGNHYIDCAAHFAQPETFDGQVPYLAALKACFPPFERFVQAVDPQIDDADWEELVTTLEKALPDIRTIPRIRVLAEFMWQVGVIHGCDHMTIADHMKLHSAFEVPPTIEAGFTDRDLKWSVRWKTMNTMAVFVRYNNSTEQQNHLVDIDNYKFEGELHTAAERFRTEILAVADDLDERGILLRHPRDLPQSVCF